jgi:hypothetical protein
MCIGGRPSIGGLVLQLIAMGYLVVTVHLFPNNILA